MTRRVNHFVIDDYDRFRYEVHSRTRDGVRHLVDLMQMVCGCEDFQTQPAHIKPEYRCQHIAACCVVEFEKLRLKILAAMPTAEKVD